MRLYYKSNFSLPTFFLVEGDLLGQDADFAVQLAEADGHEELPGQQQKMMTTYTKLMGLMKPNRLAAQ